VLRSNVTDGSLEELWCAYVWLTEAAFRIQKDERPGKNGRIAINSAPGLDHYSCVFTTPTPL